MEQGTFAWTRPSNDSNFFSGFCVQRKIFESKGEMFAITKIDVLELNDALGRPIIRSRCRTPVQIFLWNVPIKNTKLNITCFSLFLNSIQFIFGKQKLQKRFNNKVNRLN